MNESFHHKITIIYSNKNLIIKNKITTKFINYKYILHEKNINLTKATNIAIYLIVFSLYIYSNTKYILIKAINV